MRYYPLLLNLSSCRVFIAGAGDVGRRKAADILACGPARLLWLDPNVTVEELPDTLREHPALHYEQRCADSGDVAGNHLVFAATSSHAVNTSLLRACIDSGIACNVVDDPSAGSFIVPSHFTVDDFTLALSTGGASPALAKKIRRELEEWFDGRYRPLLILMKRVRPLVLALKQPSKKNAVLLRALVESNLGPALAGGDRLTAERSLREILPSELHDYIGELLHDLV